MSKISTFLMSWTTKLRCWDFLVDKLNHLCLSRLISWGVQSFTWYWVLVNKDIIISVYVEISFWGLHCHLIQRILLFLVIETVSIIHLKSYLLLWLWSGLVLRMPLIELHHAIELTFAILCGWTHSTTN